MKSLQENYGSWEEASMGTLKVMFLLYWSEQEHTKRLIALDYELKKVCAAAEKKVNILGEVYDSIVIWVMWDTVCFPLSFP